MITRIKAANSLMKTMTLKISGIEYWEKTNNQQLTCYSEAN